MFKTLACFVVVVAVVANCNAYVNSQSSNTGMNVASSNSLVSQNGIQNAQGYGGFGYGGFGYGGYGGYAPYLAAPAPVAAPIAAPIAAPLAAPIAPVGAVHPAGYYGYDAGYGIGPVGYGYGGSVNSQSTNMGANIMSTDSVVAQNHVQNAASY